MTAVSKRSIDLSAFSKYRTCEFCKYSTKSLQAITAHCKRHYQTKSKFLCENANLEKFKCHFCSFTNDLKLVVDRHIALQHHETATISDPEIEILYYGCDKCDFKTYSFVMYAIHVCDEETVTVLSEEEEVVRNAQWFECEKCPCKYKIKSQLTQHVHREHVDLEDLFFECSKCSYLTELENDLKQHIDTVHQSPEKIRWINREYCKYKSSLQEELKLHIEISHKWLHCKQCTFQTRKESDLERHALKEHTKADKKDQCHDKSKEKSIRTCNKVVTHGNFKWFECAQCPYKTKTKVCLKHHIYYKHTDPQNIKWFNCNQCSFKSKYKCNLKTHVLIKHADYNGVKWFKCKHCSYKCRTKIGLKTHVLFKHTDRPNEMRFECAQCPYRGKTKAHLKSHIYNKHTDPENIKWLKCKHCSHKCKTKTGLKSHVLFKHTDRYKEMIECAQCPYRGKTKAHLKRHIYNKHTDPQNIKWLKCKQCSYKCKIKCNLKTHVLIKHTDSNGVK